MTLNIDLKVKQVLFFSLLSVSTIPILQGSLGIYICLIMVLFFYKELIKTLIFSEVFLLILTVLILEIYHFMYFDKYEIWVIRQIALNYIIGIFVIYKLKLNFLEIYIRTLYILTMISLIIFITYLVIPTFVTTFVSVIPDIFVKQSIIYGDKYNQINPIIYNFDYNFYKGRNNGPFWEPTVFASLLIIAQIFNFLLNKVIFNKYGIVFTLGIISTLSTTGFIVYFIFIIGVLLISKKINIFIKIISTISTIIVSILLFSQLSFLEAKINTELLGIQSSILDKGGDSRMASAYLDIKEMFAKDIYIILGKGSSANSRIGGTDKTVLRNCGLTGLFVKWGVLYALTYIFLIYYSFLHLTRYFQVNTSFAFLFTILILVLSFSEVFFDLPLFHSFLFIGFIIKRFYFKPIHRFSEGTSEKPSIVNSSI